VASEFARSLYRHFGYFGLFELRLGFGGVRDRYIHPHNGYMPRMMDDVMEVTARISAATDETEFVAKVKQLIREVYWAFGLDVPVDRLESDFKFPS
jgi:hypothetical protein